MDAVHSEGLFIAEEPPVKGEDFIPLRKAHLSRKKGFEIRNAGGGAGGDGEGAVMSDKDLDAALQRRRGV